jgi:hypothetical protein
MGDGGCELQSSCRFRAFPVAIILRLRDVWQQAQDGLLASLPGPFFRFHNGLAGVAASTHALEREKKEEEESIFEQNWNGNSTPAQER